MDKYQRHQLDDYLLPIWDKLNDSDQQSFAKELVAVPQDRLPSAKNVRPLVPAICSVVMYNNRLKEVANKYRLIGDDQRTIRQSTPL